MAGFRRGLATKSAPMHPLPPPPASIDAPLPWFRLESAPGYVTSGCVASINDHQFVTSSRQRALSIYNVHTDQWTDCAFSGDSSGSGSLRLSSEPLHIAFDPRTNRVTLTRMKNRKDWLAIANLKEAWCEFVIHHTGEPIGRVPSNLVYVGDCMHVVTHFNWQDRVEHWVLNQRLVCKQKLTLPGRNHIRTIGVLVHVPSQKKLVLIKTDGVWTHSLLSDEWKQVAQGSWEDKICKNSSALLTSNERFIVIASGFDIDEETPLFMQEQEHLHFMDLREGDQQFVLQKSAITCPAKGTHSIVRTSGGIRNPLAVFGWMRRQFKNFAELELPPLCLMLFIVKWCSDEELHWVRCVEHTDDDDDIIRDHFAISIGHVLVPATD